MKIQQVKHVKRMLTSRIRDLSSINSTGLPKKLESMPMNMRKGMIKKRQERIENLKMMLKCWNCFIKS